MTDQITPALCRELGMVEWVFGRWRREFRLCGNMIAKVMFFPVGSVKYDNEPRLSINGNWTPPTASNLRSIIEQLTPHEQWLRERLRAMDHNQRLQVAMLICWDGNVRPFIKDESIDQAAAIIAGDTDA